MTVEELIAKLQKFPPKAQVCCDTSPTSYAMQPVETVRFTTAGEGYPEDWVYIGE